VEVKTTGQEAFGAPQTRVNYQKQKKIVYTAMTYMQQQALPDVALRFDVIAVVFGHNGLPEVTHIPAAFSPSAYFSY
jgi:putative endonuclease